MRYIYIITISLSLASCGPSQADKNIAAVTCSIMGETRNMDAAVRVEKLNDARKVIGGEPFLRGDDAIKEAFEWGLCQELVLNEKYDETLLSLQDAQREVERIAAEQQRAAAEIAAERFRVAAEKQRLAAVIEAEKRRVAADIAAEKQRVAADIEAEKQRVAAEKRRVEDSARALEEEFYWNGNLKSRTRYQAKTDGGKKDGFEEYYYENGQLQIKIDYKDGIKDGLEEGYYGDGQLQMKSHYKDGKNHGLSEAYHQNGQLQMKVHYKDGQVSLLELYDENGKLIPTN